MKRILFQGDSVTDSERSRGYDWRLGFGYVTMVAGVLQADAPGEYEILNRAISGNRSVDLNARIKEDLINLKPDILSLLIGANDVWHELEGKTGVSLKKSEKIIDLMLEEILESNPDMKIMLLEPFVLKGEASEKNWDVFRSRIEELAEVTKKLAEKHNLAYLPLQKMFDEAAQKAPVECWLIDGVHPTAAGYELMKREWLKLFYELGW